LIAEIDRREEGIEGVCMKVLEKAGGVLVRRIRRTRLWMNGRVVAEEHSLSRRKLGDDERRCDGLLWGGRY
jgi:phosphoribosyl-dephospho-CoA transferase